jgi:hypothetical protein
MIFRRELLRLTRCHADVTQLPIEDVLAMCGEYYGEDSLEYDLLS